MWALVRANQAGWTSPERIVGCLAGGVVLLAAFAVWEQRVSEPMVPLRLFRGRTFAIGNATTFLMSGAIFAGRLLRHPGVPVRARVLAGLGGVRLLPFFATPMLISPIAGAVSDRIAAARSW